MLGTSSAALIGLLFVATSLHLIEVVSNPAFRIRAYNVTLYLLTLLVEAGLVLIPQPLPLLGAELFILNLVGLCLPVRTSYYAHKHKAVSRRGGMKYSRAVTLGVGYILGIVGGIVLIRGFGWGMYLVTSSYFLILVTVVLGTWAILLGIEQREQLDRHPSAYGLGRHSNRSHGCPLLGVKRTLRLHCEMSASDPKHQTE